MISASFTGTALPICLYFDVRSPWNSMSAGNVCIAAASLQLSLLVSPPSPNFHSSFPIFTMSGDPGQRATCFAIAGMVYDTSSHPLLRFLLMYLLL